MMYKRPTNLHVSLATVAAAFVIFPSQADAALKHRYSFNEGTAADATGRTIVDSVSARNWHGVGCRLSATARGSVLPGGAQADPGLRRLAQRHGFELDQRARSRRGTR